MHHDQLGNTLNDKFSTSTARDVTAEAIGDASATAHDAIDRVSSSAKPAINRAAAGAHRAVDKAALAASGASESMEVQIERLLDVGAGASAKARDYVRANPLASLGIAFAAGFIFSKMRS
jgi:ElaB protein